MNLPAESRTKASINQERDYFRILNFYPCTSTSGKLIDTENRRVFQILSSITIKVKLYLSLIGTTQFKYLLVK